MDTAMHHILSKEIKLILKNRKHHVESNHKSIHLKNSHIPEYFCHDTNADSSKYGKIANSMYSEYSRILQIWNTFIANLKNAVEPKEIPKVDTGSAKSKKRKKPKHVDTTDKNKPDEVIIVLIFVNLKFKICF